MTATASTLSPTSTHSTQVAPTPTRVRNTLSICMLHHPFLTRTQAPARPAHAAPTITHDQVLFERATRCGRSPDQRGLRRLLGLDEAVLAFEGAAGREVRKL